MILGDTCGRELETLGGEIRSEEQGARSERTKRKQEPGIEDRGHSCYSFLSASVFFSFSRSSLLATRSLSFLSSENAPGLTTRSQTAYRCYLSVLAGLGLLATAGAWDTGKVTRRSCSAHPHFSAPMAPRIARICPLRLG